MKRSNKGSHAIAAAGAWRLSNIVSWTKAFQYGRAAESDERNGFPFTAAMEWHKAAELLGANTWAADYCWRQWERIMHLPRRFASPIGVPQQAALRVATSS